jgi:phosphoglycolate phosphatase-like HAD superfamily hydrolase
MQPSSSAVLVLFDIDGTLIRTAGAGVRGMNDAFERLHGRRDAMLGVPVSGRTDRAILTEVFGRWNQELTEAVVGPLRDRYLEELSREMQAVSGEGVGVLPGVHEALDTLDRDPSFALGLLTGNFERGAEIKLARFDLWRRFRFGAFGDEHTDRRALVPVAVERARACGIEAAHVVVIGDTPLDVDCAHAHGARAVAVATGEYSRDALAATGAEIVVDTLERLHPITDRLATLCAMSR